VKVIDGILFVLHGFVGVGAIGGGLAAIIHPKEPLGVSVEALKYSPFQDFLIPGIILFTVLGLGNIFSAGLMIRSQSRYQGYISSIFSWALVIWIVVQAYMLRNIIFLHILFFLIGILQGILSMTILVKNRSFPMDVILDTLKKKRENAS